MSTTITTVRTLTLSDGISRGRETYGYTIVRLRDTETGKLYRCMGGGYDMSGTVLADWLTDMHQGALRTIASRAHATYGGTPHSYATSDAPNALYGMGVNVDTGHVSVDGACGVESVVRIAEAAGVKLTRTHNRGETTGWEAEAVSTVGGPTRVVFRVGADRERVVTVLHLADADDTDSIRRRIAATGLTSPHQFPPSAVTIISAAPIA